MNIPSRSCPLGGRPLVHEINRRQLLELPGARQQLARAGRVIDDLLRVIELGGQLLPVAGRL